MRTLNVLIVDDEAFVVDWIISLLDSQGDLPLNLFSCYGVTEAERMIEERRIDILLSDIRMPDGNGLDLIAAVRRRWADCRVLLLTAYSEFEYAQRAIRGGADGYILKTEKDAIILSEVRRAAAALNATLDQRQRSLDLEQDLDRYMLLYRNTLFFQWLRGELNAPGQAGRCMRELGLAAELPLYLAVGRVHPDEEGDEPQLTALRAKLSGQCLLEESTRTVVAEVRGSDACFLLQPKLDYAQNYQGLLEEQFEAVASACCELYGARISFAISDAVRHPDELSMNYWALCKVLNGVAAGGETFLYRMAAPASEAKKKPGFTGQIAAMAESLECGDEAGLSHAFFQIESAVSGGVPVTDAQFQNAYLSVALALADALARTDCDAAGAMDLGALYVPTAHAGTAEAFGYLRGVAGCILSEIQQQRLTDKNRLIAEIDQFLIENANRPISLSDLSDHFNYNADYLSRLYSAATGNTLKKAITEIRIQLMENLMRRPELSLNDILEKMGFKSRTYFNFFVKNALGTTPSQYRQQLVGGEEEKFEKSR